MTAITDDRFMHFIRHIASSCLRYLAFATAAGAFGLLCTVAVWFFGHLVTDQWIAVGLGITIPTAFIGLNFIEMVKLQRASGSARAAEVPVTHTAPTKQVGPAAADTAPAGLSADTLDRLSADTLDRFRSLLIEAVSKRPREAVSTDGDQTSAPLDAASQFPQEAARLPARGRAAD
jgi:hypothetical protein